MKTQRIGLALIAVVVLAGACGRLGDDGGATGSSRGGTGHPTGTSAGGIDHPTGADELVLRVEYQGGFVPFEYTLRRVPSWSLYGDGTVIVEGPVIEIYPGPALPSLLALTLTEEAVQAILEEARDAGLMVGRASYEYPCIADAPDTVFTVNADGATSVVSAYALGFSDPETECPGVDIQARAELREFGELIGDLQSWLPEGSIGPEQPYVPTEVRVYVLPYAGQPDLPQTETEWPLAEPLVAFGERIVEGGEARCGVVGGDDLNELLPLAQQANELTPWTSGGEQYRLVFRPLLLDEHTC